jgi:hypothetical protein
MAEEMTAQEAAEWGKTLSFETVWALITKNEKKLDELGQFVKEVC